MANIPNLQVTLNKDPPFKVGGDRPGGDRGGAPPRNQ